MHEAYFFGPRNRQLFASYHPPEKVDRRLLTVICPPLFAEFNRTHRALRNVAISLAESGQHVIRFDYRGTGDSFGDLEEATISGWVEDVAMAIQEGREVSGVNTVRILGVRAGALLACKSVGEMSEVQRLVLWDPVTDGSRYLQSLRRLQNAILAQNIYLRRAERLRAMHEYEYGGGNRLSEFMVKEFNALGSSAYLSVPTDKLHVVSTSPLSNFPVEGIFEEVSPFVCDWETHGEDLIMAQPVLERLVECLTTI